jgi:arabinogalactan endo-1,4-beta-galactosidase
LANVSLSIVSTNFHDARQKKCRIPRGKISLLAQLEKENRTYHSAQENFEQLLQIYINWLVNLVRIRIFTDVFKVTSDIFSEKEVLTFQWDC